MQILELLLYTDSVEMWNGAGGGERPINTVHNTGSLKSIKAQIKAMEHVSNEIFGFMINPGLFSVINSMNSSTLIIFHQIKTTIKQFSLVKHLGICSKCQFALSSDHKSRISVEMRTIASRKPTGAERGRGTALCKNKKFGRAPELLSNVYPRKHVWLYCLNAEKYCLTLIRDRHEVEWAISRRWVQFEVVNLIPPQCQKTWVTQATGITKD